VRGALCAALFLSVTAAFGLHPEPTASRSAAAEPGIAAKAALVPPAHDCLACLKGGTFMPAAPGGLPPAAADSAAATTRPASNTPNPIACGNLSGRSPPAGVSS